MERGLASIPPSVPTVLTTVATASVALGTHWPAILLGHLQFIHLTSLLNVPLPQWPRICLDLAWTNLQVPVFPEVEGENVTLVLDTDEAGVDADAASNNLTQTLIRLTRIVVTHPYSELCPASGNEDLLALIDNTTSFNMSDTRLSDALRLLSRDGARRYLRHQGTSAERLFLSNIIDGAGVALMQMLLHWLLNLAVARSPLLRWALNKWWRDRIDEMLAFPGPQLKVLQAFIPGLALSSTMVLRFTSSCRDGYPHVAGASAVLVAILLLIVQWARFIRRRVLQRCYVAFIEQSAQAGHGPGSST